MAQTQKSIAVLVSTNNDKDEDDDEDEEEDKRTRKDGRKVPKKRSKYENGRKMNEQRSKCFFLVIRMYMRMSTTHHSHALSFSIGFLLDMHSRFVFVFPLTTKPSGTIQSIRTCISRSIQKNMQAKERSSNSNNNTNYSTITSIYIALFFSPFSIRILLCLIS